MLFTSETRLDQGPIEREFTLDDIPGILWTPPTASAADPAPLILLGQPGGIGLRRMHPRLGARARSAAAQGFASVAIELPGAGGRPALPGVEKARADLMRAISVGERPDDDIIDRLILPLVERAVPEWQAALDAVLGLPEIGERVGFSGGVTAIAVRLAATDRRIAAARRITIPLHVLLQWDDEGNDRQMALDLFDAFASTEKTLCANMGGHTGVPSFAGEDAARFFARHLDPIGD